MTPGVRPPLHFPPQTSQTSPIYRRMGASMLAQSPPLESISPIGQNPQFHFRRPPSASVASHTSSRSDRACDTSDAESGNEDDSGHESVHEEERPARKVDRPDFVLEPLDSDDSDLEHDSGIEVVRPDHYEDAKSEASGCRLDENGLLYKFQEMRCAAGSSDEEERQRLYRRKKKRWSRGIFKRSHSQSVEGDSSYSDNDPLDDVDVSARRLRRRVKGPGDRTSLHFVDQGFANTSNIVEVEEPDDSRAIPHFQGPPSIPSDDGFTLDELPFWLGEDPMDVEFESA
ncbi:hypothetical protein M011DRAFT_494738 [Sporormia fimetaria CBS 119925]|uniref:Uncharacterized protein n=1 Tax=Sporormia fimetaria CBS 119925 TaxID=1340428 RepID=A0A6A6V8E4_9PLEO|nr:hypothetical protein M011DRAFT_494738 [Sporormia fimetaria CBS 119925]